MKTLVQKILATALVFLSLLEVQGVTYYFSATSGSDTRTAAQATNPSTPWRSIEKLNSIMNTLTPGDSVLFKRGETFYGTILITVSGTTSNKIYFGAFGTGAAPILSGATKITTWKSIGNGVYEASHANFTSEAVNVLVMNGVNQEMGRYPNSNGDNKGYLNFEDFVGNNVLIDNDWKGGTNWVGAEVVVRKNPWIIDRMKVTSVSGTRITFDAATGSTYGLRKDWGYFLQNHRGTLDQLGEWFYDVNTKKLYVFFGSQSPTNFDVQVGTRNSIITNSGRVSDIVFESLELFAANKDAISLASANNFKFSNLNITFAGVTGIDMLSCSRPIIEGVTVLNANNNGIRLRAADDAEIRGNKVIGTYLFPGMGLNGDNNGNAIFSPNSNNIIEYNEVLNSGYIGIRFGGNNSIVRYNIVDTYGLVKNDGGGIYTYTGKSNAEFYNRKVVNNIVVNGIGVREGTNIQSPLFRPQVEGVYFDDNASGVELAHNIIYNIASKGIFLHNARRIHVHSNLVYNTGVHLFFGNDNLGASIVDNVIENNVFVGKDKEELNMNFNSIANDIKAMGNFSNNIYANPFSDNFRISTRVNMGGSGDLSTLYDLDSWKKAYSTDYGSTNHPFEIEQWTITKLIGANRFANERFDSNVLHVTTNGCTSAWESNSKLDGGALRINGSGSFAGVFGVGSVSKDKSYVLSFSGMANASVPAKVFLRHGGSPWSEISAASTVKFDLTRNEYKVKLSPVLDVASAVVLIRFEGVPAMNAWIDNIVFTEAELDIARPEDYIFFEYNASTSPKTYPLVGTYYDMAKKPFSKQVTVAPFSGVLLMKSSKEMALPEIKLSVPSEDGVVNGSSLNLGVAVSGDQSWVQKVNYFNADTLVGTSETAPYGFEWERLRTGSYTVHAEALNESGEKITSPAMAIQFTRPEIFPLVDIELVSGPEELMLGDAVQLKTVAFAPDGTIEKVDIFKNGSLFTTLTNEPYEVNWVSDLSGDFEVCAVAYNCFGLSAVSDTLNITVKKLATGIDVEALNAANNMYTLFLNTGSAQHASIDAIGFVGESSENSYFSSSRTNSNANASDMVLFQSERHATTLSYQVPVPNGEYRVVTFHNELWFGKSGPAQRAGQRVFDIFIQNELRAAKFDLFQYSRNQPAMQVFDKVSVTDERLNISLQAHANQASISGIAIIQLSKPTPDFVIPVGKPIDVEPFFELHLNAGDSRMVDIDAVSFIPDQSMGGIFTSSSTFRNADASAINVLQSERNGTRFSYHIPVDNGTYTVVTYHNELWFGKNGPAAAAGRRVFDIAVEGELKMKDFDIFQVSNNEPTSLVFEQIEVTDGMLSLDLASTKDRASISGLSIYGVRKPEPIRLLVNVGSTSSADFRGFEFVSENSVADVLNYTQSSTFSNPNACYEPMFTTERHAPVFEYAIPVPNGSYTINTFHNELWFGKGGPAAGPGKRIYNISIEGKVLRTGFDLFTIGNNRSYILAFRNVVVTDGVLNIRLEATANNASLSGLAVMTEVKRPTTQTANSFIRGYREMGFELGSLEEVVEEGTQPVASASKIYPNPARDYVNISLGEYEVTPDYFYIHDVSGKLVSGVQPSEVRNQNGYQLAVNQLPEGIYMVSVMAQNTVSERFKLMVTK
ncbi:malectin domain-containing carbohydrate-binding protein [Lunatimonas salinarum]|uniref:malectin domain-containing carbohydrate-binding protein n=1 Tax=Lunatimonas salinarum TaxID=1774590 RepID=UPI001ADFE982|nr:malectin domain-containing carbohydrate-binding protein [Lunatimonas salinarum]